jgi:hypothetical protein
VYVRNKVTAVGCGRSSERAGATTPTTRSSNTPVTTSATGADLVDHTDGLVVPTAVHVARGADPG